MSAICFVCNLPILSHQVGLVWEGGNGYDDIHSESSSPRPRVGRRDSSAQITTIEPPREVRETSPPTTRRRRSSLAQLTDILRDWGRRETTEQRSTSTCTSNTSTPVGPLARRESRDLTRRESLADIAKSLPWRRRDSMVDVPRNKTRRESSAEMKKRRQSGTDIRTDIAKFLARRESVAEILRRRRDSLEQEKKERRDSTTQVYSRSSRNSIDKTASPDRPEIHSPRHVSSPEPRDLVPRPIVTTQASAESHVSQTSLVSQVSSCKDQSEPGIIEPRSPVSSPAPSSPTTTIRRDSTTQIYRGRRDSRPQVSPERGSGRGSREPSPKFRSLRRQSTTFEENLPIPGSRRGSRPFLSPDAPETDGLSRKGRRDSLSPDSAAAEELSLGRRARRDSRPHLSPEASDSNSRETSPRSRLRRQSTTAVEYHGRGRRSSRSPRSPDSSSTCSSREHSPKERGLRRQSTTEEILISRGFRRQSTTEDIMRARNFRRQSTQSEEMSKSRGRRDSCAQITDGTIATMTVETSCAFFDTSTQTGKKKGRSSKGSLYDNNNYHEECLRCNSCGLNLTGPNQTRARRYKNQFLCDLHFADVALMETSDFLQQLRSFKPQSLGCAVARRKSSTTLIFPLPPQACADEFCTGYPHNLLPTPGYWIECAGTTLPDDTIWDESEPELDDGSPQSDHPDKSDQNIQVRRPQCLLQVCPGGQVPVINEPSRQKTCIQEQYERNGQFELTSIEQETYEKYFYGSEHWNYFTQDEDLGPVILSLKQETSNGRDQFRIMVRGISYTVHGLVPASCVFADRYNREEVVRSFGREINLNPPLVLGQLPDIPEELLKLDQVFIKSELKVGVVYVREEQYTEEEILDNNDTSPLFEEFLQILGDKVRLKGFDKYKGGLDTVHDLTGLYSVYAHWRNIEIMFHVSTLLPYEKHDPQKLQRKRHIGNDIVCVVFLEADNTPFSPACIKSHFLHTFIVVRTSPRIKFKPTRYEVAVVSRDEVGAYKPYLWEQSCFEKGPMFREWLLTKIVNGERASYSAPKFARMQDRTRSQMLEDLVNNLQNHAETGQIPKPYRRGSWRPIGHMRPSSPLLDSVRDLFEGHDQLAKDFTRAFHNSENQFNNMLYDVTFLVGAGKEKFKLYGVRAILGVRSRVFQEMLYGFSTGFGSPQVSVADILARAVPTLHSPSHKPKSSNFLQVPDIETPRPKSVPNSPIVMRAFSRLGTLTAGWGRSIKKHDRLSVEDKKKWASSQDCSGKEGKEKQGDKNALAVPRLSVCADVAKVDRARLCQTEVRVTVPQTSEQRQTQFTIIEFEHDTLRILLDYLHTGSCPLTCTTIPGLICAAEHYDLPELLQACFHHAKQFLRIEVVCNMLSSLENYYWRYTSASELVNMILAFVETRAPQVFQSPDFLQLSESMVHMMMARNLEVAEITKFEAMLAWAKHKVRIKGVSKADSRVEFRCIMERLTRELKPYRISPQDLIKIVLPSKAIKNERILETLMFQANSGMYRINDSYLEACQQRLQKQDSKFSEWESFDYGL
ncbi:uncharacterized protein rsh isoform X4 [Palaemon carinicauda]|uniref:uncharacterized protein rsh isoform X4 n=1 Tax=Palaemon carinicauda TaxID=392227 RepID=UPI0035B5FEC5